MTTTAERGLRIAELARAVGVPTDTVRYYERVGLLPPPRRTAGGWCPPDEKGGECSCSS
jgi:predicted site-specific integrase-resolvase